MPTTKNKEGQMSNELHKAIYKKASEYVDGIEANLNLSNDNLPH